MKQKTLLIVQKKKIFFRERLFSIERKLDDKQKKIILYLRENRIDTRYKIFFESNGIVKKGNYSI
jgi:hypothetical protein